jgi:5'-nucleotidase
VPGLAFSLVASRSYDFSDSARIAREVTERALREGIPDGTLLNVNVPIGRPKGLRVTMQGFKSSRPVISEHIDPRGRPYYWIGEVRDGFRAEGGTDFEAVDEGYVSITPMRADMTNHSVLEELRSWDLEHDLD